MQRIFFLKVALARDILNLSGFYLIGAHLSKHNNKKNKIMKLRQVPEVTTKNLDNNEKRECMILLGENICRLICQRNNRRASADVRRDEEVTFVTVCHVT